jgi:peroxin-1
MATYHQPSVLIWDDLDSLLVSENEVYFELIKNERSSRPKQLAHYFADLHIAASKENDVLLIAAVQDPMSLQKRIRTTHIFGKEMHLKAPNKTERIEILSSLLNEMKTMRIGTLNLQDVAGSLEGYSIADMVQFHRYCMKEATIRHIDTNCEFEITNIDLKRALDSYKPFAKTSSKVESSVVEWSDVGGMSSTKELLIQTLKWPTLYPQIFKNCPLRLRSGVLLYGFPGCGKTMLASAVAKECGMNFISVKGPELLNKYIGQSEKQVRDVFERARQCAPCCLFFDEFDSIAPRRGNDNSGVTDRVVNQLLTEMDGAQGLQGVFVLAATSRPEMIDPALLRPGRFDKAILCDMPTAEERADIITCVSKTIALKDVDVNWIAKETEGFTGADLQGLLYTAQLQAIHECMSYDSIAENTTTHVTPFTILQGTIDSKSIKETVNISKEKKHLQDSNRVFVRSDHVIEALKQTKPSLRSQELFLFKKRYRQFQGLDSVPIGQKASFQ